MLRKVKSDTYLVIDEPNVMFPTLSDVVNKLTIAIARSKRPEYANIVGRSSRCIIRIATPPSSSDEEK